MQGESVVQSDTIIILHFEAKVKSFLAFKRNVSPYIPQAKAWGLGGKSDKILPIILSDDVQASVTPEIVLQESEQDNDSGSELLVELE